MKTHLINGPITSEFLAAVLDKHYSKTNIGAHSFFLGTVRADQIGEKTVSAIEYSAYEEMIAGTVKQIKDVLFEKYNNLVCLHIYHSTGEVKVGQHSLLVMVSSGHRKQAFAACQECVELIKEKLPVWKKELYHDGSHDWLKN